MIEHDPTSSSALGTGGDLSRARPDQPMSECPEAETLAAYLDRRLESAEHEAIQAHLADCDDCREITSDIIRLMTANEEAPAKAEAPAKVLTPVSWWTPRRKQLVGLLTAAAALILIASWTQHYFSKTNQIYAPELSALVTASSNYRPFQARLSGGFQHSDVVSPERGPTSGRLPLVVQAEAMRLTSADSQSKDPAHLAAAGDAYLFLGEVNAAVSALESAVRLKPEHAGWLSDLAAAYLVRAQRTDQPDDLKLALVAAEHAVALSPNLPEAWFNLALANEASQQPDQARQAWQVYLSLDKTSPWSKEAAEHLAALR
jgi:tetratricopeptide (TPR) repeat protein